MKLTHRLDRVEARDGLADARQRRAREAADEVHRRLKSYAEELPSSAALLPEADRQRTMSLAMQLAWQMRFGREAA